MTERQEQVFNAICDFADDHGYAPTVRELCRICELESTSTLHAHLASLQKMGLVDWVEGQARTLHVTAVAA